MAPRSNGSGAKLTRLWLGQGLLAACSSFNASVGPPQLDCASYSYAAANGYSQPYPTSGATNDSSCADLNAGSDCNTCLALNCCAALRNCYATSSCSSADETWDDCVAAVHATDSGTAQTLAQCYASFAANGPTASDVVTCVRRCCAMLCLMTQ